MSRIKETITALSAGNEPGAVRISRKTRGQTPERHFEMILECIVTVSLIASGTALLIFADIWKIVALMFFAVLISMIYFGMKD